MLGLEELEKEYEPFSDYGAIPYLTKGIHYLTETPKKFSPVKTAVKTTSKGGVFRSIWGAVKKVGKTTWNITKGVASTIDKVVGSKTMQTTLQAAGVILPTVVQIKALKAARKPPPKQTVEYVYRYADSTVRTTQRAGIARAAEEYTEYLEPYAREEERLAEARRRYLIRKRKEEETMETIKKYSPLIIGGAALTALVLGKGEEI